MNKKNLYLNLMYAMYFNHENMEVKNIYKRYCAESYSYKLKSRTISKSSTKEYQASYLQLLLQHLKKEVWPKINSTTNNTVTTMYKNIHYSCIIKEVAYNSTNCWKWNILNIGQYLFLQNTYANSKKKGKRKKKGVEENKDNRKCP